MLVRMFVTMNGWRARANILGATTLVGAALLALASLPASADKIYRWVDAGGVVNYTQQKPRDTESEAIITQGGTSRPVRQAPAPVPELSAATGQPLSAEQEKMLDGLRAAEQARQAEIAKIKEQNCQESRDVLARLTLKSRIRVRDEDGDYRVMPENERQERIARAQENVALYCVS